MAAVADTARPLVAGCRVLARVGSAGLWNEVGDGFALGVAHQLRLAGDGQVASLLGRATAVAGMPWRAQPEVRVVASAHGPVFVVRKGGCCLAHTAPSGEYCGTCSLRDWSSCCSHQLAWLRQQHTTPEPRAPDVDR